MKSSLQDTMVTIPDAEKLFNLKKTELYSMIEAGQIKTERIGKHVKISTRGLQNAVKCNCRTLITDTFIPKGIKPGEIEMIADWT